MNGFTNTSKRWLVEWVKTNVTPKTAKQYELYVARAAEFFGDKPVCTIRTRDIQAFLNTQTHLKPKSKATVAACLKSFYTWLEYEEIVDRSPRFPKIKYRLGSRKTVNKESQSAIIDEIRQLTGQPAPKAWVAIKWLSTYVCLRPGDIARIRECDVDRRNRVVYIRNPKASEPYEVPLTPADVELLNSIPAGDPEQPFFRHNSGQPFGPTFLYDTWKRACKNLGIEGVDLYGGTRHSSVRALRHTHTPEQIKWATLHRTNAAFERYFSVDSEYLTNVYQQAEGGE